MPNDAEEPDATGGLRHRFREVVTSADALRAVVGQPNKRAVAKVVRALDAHARRFIAHSPFVFVASAGADGTIDISPKGDPPGFVKVLDDRTLAVPDRPGNRRIDTFHNVLANPRVGLIFVIPGDTFTLRVSGTAVIVRDLELREALAANGKLPDHALVVGVSRVLSHCPKCMIRSGLWKADAWPDTGGLPSFAEVMVAHGKLAQTVEEMQAIIDAGNRERLY
jgi:PPOX class probable FMN-dependent enzyme